ncbi:MAG: methyltransferase domain-containing protein [Verrucomicrobiae bacterium]|nr:methyltransferase domain-containing protein [Verrucomicrobiae bacterium]
MSDYSTPTAVKRAKTYYDNPDADEFYYRIWGGEDIHIGLYKDSEEAIAKASHRTVVHMASKIKHRLAGTHVLDMGAGYGGSARYLARKKGYRVICLNLSEAQNERNREITLNEMLSVLVDVVDGNFEDVPYDDEAFDVVWSQDAILHSGNRQRVFEEADRVLRPGGDFIFTDPMQTESAESQVIEPVLERIDLESLGSPEAYLEYARDLGWELVDQDLQPDQLVNHYSRVLDVLQSSEEDLREWCSEDYLERMKTGLKNWINAGRQDALTWGFLHFRKAKA